MTLVRVWPVGAAPTAAPIVTNAYNADGSAYTGSIATLELPSGNSVTSASEGAVNGIYQDTFTIATQNVIPPLTKPLEEGAGRFRQHHRGRFHFHNRQRSGDVPRRIDGSRLQRDGRSVQPESG